MALSKKGLASLAAIAASATGFVMLTQAEGKELVDAGLASVDTANVDGDKAAVSLTEAGLAQVQGNSATAAPAASTGGFEIETGIEMPASTARRGRTGGYPFDKLEVGQSFHVAKSAENTDPVTRLASSVTGARVRFSEKTGETETVEVKTYKRGEDGKYAKDANGKRIVEGTSEVTRDKMRATRDFKVMAVDASDPKGEGARVWRTV